MKKVLWTGGWDSTYRLLDLTVNKGLEVQPYYVLDDGRASQARELKTMELIKAMLYSQFPDTKGLVKDTIKFQKNAISQNKKITIMWQNLKNKSFMGSQYEWLGRYAEENKIYDLELNIHQDDKASVFLYEYVEKVTSGKDSYFKLKKIKAGSDLELFQYYHFPILELTKTDMQNKAKESGFDNIMEKTWFCFKPTLRGTACGNCNPCKYTKEEGLARRVPSGSIALYNRIEGLVHYSPRIIKGAFNKILR